MPSTERWRGAPSALGDDIEPTTSSRNIEDLTAVSPSSSCTALLGLSTEFPQPATALSPAYLPSVCDVEHGEVRGQHGAVARLALAGAEQRWRRGRDGLLLRSWAVIDLAPAFTPL